ncbi:MAG TPA: cysteine rich repeat-containing protein [Xanthobacteraceae bacterium]
MNKRALSKQFALAIVLALGAATVARAETAEEQQACTNDAFQFCQSAIPDRTRVFNCLVSNRDQISPACHTAMAPYLPVDAKRQAAAPSPSPAHEKTAKTKGPLNLTPH